MNGRPVVIITGASRGIGRAIAEDLAAHDYIVWLLSRHGTELETLAEDIRRKGGNAEFAEYDVTQHERANEIIDHVMHTSGRLDGLVNNAGINRRGSLTDVRPEDYDAIMDTNVKGLLFLSQAVCAAMQDGGSIVNIASLNAFDVLKGVGMYAASKAAVVQLTRAMAIDVADHGIRVNAVAPGFIRTDFNASLWQRPELKAWVEENTPLGRLGTPQDVVGVVRFLLSPDSAFVTGAVVPVDGGVLPARMWPL